jgi:hypothetical protein
MHDATSSAAGHARTEDPREPRHGRRWGRPGIGPLAGVLTATSALFQLLATPVLGLADNGDYKRVLSRLHLVAVVPPGESSSFKYIWLDYSPGGTPNESYQSTELIFIRIVHRLVVFLGFGPGMDLRAAGISHALLLGTAVWLIVRALPGPSGLCVLTSLLLIVVLTDTRFVVYLDSFFTEPASLLALLFLVAAFLHAGRRPTFSPLTLLAMGAAATALVLSKSQYAPLAFPIALLLLARPRPGGRLASGKRGLLLPACTAAFLLVVAGVYLQHQPADLDKDNRYNAVFVELLGHSSNPAADLRALGLDPALAPYSGRAIYLPRNATDDPHFDNFYTTITHRRIASFYATHPGRSLSLAHRGATAVMELKPRGVSPPLGTQTKASGAKPYYNACKLCLYSSVSRAWRSLSGLLVPALWFAASASVWGLLRRRRSGSPKEGLAVSLILLLSLVILSMTISLLGEGEFEIVKHLYLASAGNGLLAVLIVHSLGLLAWEKFADHRSTTPESAEDNALSDAEGGTTWGQRAQTDS